MKLLSWNVNGLRACMNKNFNEFFYDVNADIFCLQETKLQEGQIDFAPEGYYCYWNYAEKKGYSGTAIFTKEKPIHIQYGMGIEEHDKEGRLITLEFDDYYLVTVYVPNSQRELKRIEYRMKWEDDFRNYILSLDKSKPVIYCGDLNVAHKEIDLKIRKQIITMQALRIMKEKNFLPFLTTVLPIPSDIFIPIKKEFTAGGLICLRQEKKTRAGELIILSYQTGLKTGLQMPKYTPIFSALTTALLKLILIYK